MKPNVQTRVSYLFTDVVKPYNVTCNAEFDDMIARKEFSQNAQNTEEFLVNELDIIKPNKVIALGNESYRFLSAQLKGKYEVEKVRHTS